MPLGRKAIREGVPLLREKMSAAGRDPASLEVISLLGSHVDHDMLDTLQQSGATTVLVDVPPESRDAVLRHLDRIAEVVAARGSIARG
jgi:hypothetical protein